MGVDKSRNPCGDPDFSPASTRRKALVVSRHYILRSLYDSAQTFVSCAVHPVKWSVCTLFFAQTPHLLYKHRIYKHRLKLNSNFSCSFTFTIPPWGMPQDLSVREFTGSILQSSLLASHRMAE